MSNHEALEKIAEHLHDEPVESLSDREKQIAKILEASGHGRIEEHWNWSRTKRVVYFLQQ